MAGRSAFKISRSGLRDSSDLQNAHSSATQPNSVNPLVVRKLAALTWIRTHDWDAQEWRDRAACRDTTPELFFPIGTTGGALDQIEAARRVCGQCPVTTECLEFALGTNQESGVWGGLTEEERRRLRKGEEAAPAAAQVG